MLKTTVQDFIYNLSQRILKESEWSERTLTNASVTLRKRFRDVTDDDRTGLFNPDTGNWVSVDVPNIYSWNIVKPTIRGNTSSMATARVKVNVEPRFPKDSKSEMAAQVGQAVLEQKERLQWTTQLEEQIADEQQLGSGVFIRTRWNPHIKTLNKVAKWSEEDSFAGGEAVCGQCGSVQNLTDEVLPDDDGFASVKCPDCEGDAQVTQFPKSQSNDVIDGHDEMSFGDSETSVHPFWNFRVDTQNTQGGDLSKARWFENHYLASKDELELEYPESTDAVGTQARWSYPLRWQYALQTGNTYPAEGSDGVDEYREVRDIYLTPAKYLIFENTTDFDLRDADGNERFSLQGGKGLKEAKFEGNVIDEPPVWCFRLVGNSVIDIFPCNFVEEFEYVTFLVDPSTFWGAFYTEMISLQDIVNYMLTLQVYHIRRNAITSIVYNKGVFNPDDFEEDLIPTKEEFPYDFPISEQYSIVPALTLSAEPMNMLQMIIQGKGSVSLVQPALLGEASPGEPYHAQLLQKQQSLGLLAPAELSKAKAKVGWTKQQLRLKQQNWTDEDSETMLKLNSEWTEDFIDAFLHCSLDEDLIIDFVEGSEIPRSLLEREMQLRQFTQDLMLFANVNPQLLSQETVNDVLMQLAESGDLDIDINNVESDLRLAESRCDKIREMIDGIQSSPESAQQQAEFLMSQPTIQLVLMPGQQENHAVHVEFLGDKIRNEAAKDGPNYLFINCLNVLITWHNVVEVQAAQRKAQMAIAAQAPMQQMAQEQQMQQSQAEQQGQVQQQQQAQLQAQNDQQVQNQQNAEAQQQKAQQDEQAAQNQHQRELQMKILDLKDKERDRQVAK